MINSSYLIRGGGPRGGLFTYANNNDSKGGKKKKKQ